MNIIVNARELALPAKYRRLSYDEVAVLAFGPSYDDDIVTVTFSRGPKAKSQGTLVPGETTTIRHGMIFTAVRTNKA